MVVIVAIIIGIGSFFLVSRKPELFWPLFIGLTLVSSGIMIAGYAVVDEYFAVAVLGGGFLAAKRGLVSRRPKEKTPLHWWVFLFMVVYLILESVRGTIFLQDVKVLRWVGYFFIFGALLWLTWRWRFPLPSAVRVAKITSIASSVYFGSYFLLGFISECVMGIWRWTPQGSVWAGSLYAVFPIIFSFPAALFLLKEGDKKSRWLGWLTIFTSVLAVGFYESRIGWIALFVMLLFVPLVLGLRRMFRVAPGLIVIFGLTFLWTLSPLATPYWLDGKLLSKPYCHTFLTKETTFTEVSRRMVNTEWYKIRADIFEDGISATILFPITPRTTDLDRALHLKASFLTLIESPSRFLFGGGTYSHRLLLRPHLRELYNTELLDAEIGPVVRTSGLPAIFVDFGIIGLALIILNLLLSMKALISGSNRRQWRRATILLFAFILIPFWLSGGNIQDLVIYFWSLMPLNLFLFLLPREGVIL